MIYDREAKTISKDMQYGSKYLNFLYNNILGRVILKLIICPAFSKIYGKYNNMSISKKKVDTFIKKYNIDTNEYNYSSINNKSHSE